MVLIDRADADFPVPLLQRSELESALELMGHGGFVAIDEEMRVICFRRGFHFIFELVGVLCLEFRAVGGRKDSRETVLGRRRQGAKLGYNQ
jgi:hypothetical protein